MEKTELTLRIEKHLVDVAKRYAREHDTTISELVSDFLCALGKQAEPPSDTPILDELTGILPSEAADSDYRRHLEKKHGG